MMIVEQKNSLSWRGVDPKRNQVWGNHESVQQLVEGKDRGGSEGVPGGSEGKSSKLLKVEKKCLRDA